ncbi:response regulator transcription factor [Enterobacter sp. RIT418]|uniref:response regulator transcription factor n=1 Tax=Enterobacter sp. RIT418 TaxID=2202164 RepID=UPI000D45ACEB|nr:response regulator transcription factor [Enterobacter sp. RIT 418]RAU34287.1 DNA-binding response regulator [Enterobacter sp. RIT 418]
MRVIMFDRQSIFIHGAINSLRTLIPEINITGARQADEFLSQLSASPTAIALIDGNILQDENTTLLEDLQLRFPRLSVAIVLAKKDPRYVEKILQRNVMAVIPRNAAPEMFSTVLHSIARGMVCLPGEWLHDLNAPQQDLSQLSERQYEVLKRLAAGESNKEIGRSLNISAGTVKAHLETLFRRLEVKNRTQAAMLYTRMMA